MFESDSWIVQGQSRGVLLEPLELGSRILVLITCEKEGMSKR